MSTSEKSEKDLNEEVPKNNKENLKTEKIKEKLIDPLSLLSSDLLKEINNIDEKKENSEDNTQKESDDNESDENDTNPSVISNSLNNELLNFNVKPKQQSSSCLNNINLNLNLFDNDNPMFKENMKRLNNNCCYNCPNRNHYNKDFNNNMNMSLNNFSDKLNFFNNSFTMNGKQGWICTSCKNFNYESKYLIILFNIIVRIKCNRCGKKNDNLFNQQNSYGTRGGNANINMMYHPMNEIGEGMNEIYHCPLMKAKIFLKGNNTQENDNRKPFNERPGDWICYNCQNLNFTFRTNCNRCHISKIQNQKLIHDLEMQKYLMNINNHHQ